MRTRRARPSTPLLPSLLLLTCMLAACGSSEHEASHGAQSSGVSPGLAPRTKPEPAPEVAPEPEPEPEPAPPVDPVLEERKQALANVGRTAFDALQAGDFASFMHLTAADEGYLRDRCPTLPGSPREELEARFNHCHKQIAWDSVAEAQVFAGEPTGEQAVGCEDGVEDYGRLQLFLHMKDKTIWRVDFFGAVGEGGNAIGINGEVSCREVPDAPQLK